MTKDEALCGLLIDPVLCRYCDGSGESVADQVCPVCDGFGMEPKQQEAS